MKKTVLIGLIICVFVLGTMGFAFATGLDFLNGVGALSHGYDDVPQANVYDIRWGVEWSSSPNAPVITFVRLSFDRWLAKGTGIGIAVYDDDNNLLDQTLWIEIDAPLSAYTDKIFHLKNPVNVEEVYHISVTVGEPRPEK